MLSQVLLINGAILYDVLGFINDGEVPMQAVSMSCCTRNHREDIPLIDRYDNIPLLEDIKPFRPFGDICISNLQPNPE